MVENQSDNYMLYEAVRQNDIYKLRQAIGEKIKNQQDPLIPITPAGQTIMHYACCLGYLDLLQEMIETYGLDFDKREDVNQKTPLFYAASCGHLDVVKFLIDKGANINARNIGNETPAMKAAFYGQTKVLDYLLESGAQIDTTNYVGQTIKDIARLNGRQEIIQLLAEKYNCS